MKWREFFRLCDLSTFCKIDQSCESRKAKYKTQIIEKIVWISYEHSYIDISHDAPHRDGTSRKNCSHSEQSHTCCAHHRAISPTYNSIDHDTRRHDGHSTIEWKEKKDCREKSNDKDNISTADRYDMYESRIDKGLIVFFGQSRTISDQYSLCQSCSFG